MDVNVGIWISGFVSGIGASVVVWTVVYLIVDMVQG